MPVKQPWEWRPNIQKATDTAYYMYGEDRGWPGIVPYEIMEALIKQESGGDSDAYNDTPMPNGEHATGLMQIVPGLSITGAYEQVTQSSINKSALFDPDFNLEVGAIGLAERAMDVQHVPRLGFAIDDVDQSWPTVVTIGWFGAGYKDRDGVWRLDPSVRDEGSNTDGALYRQNMDDYIKNFDSYDSLNKGYWRNPSDPTREEFYPPKSIDNYDNLDLNLDFVKGAYKGVDAIVDGAVKGAASIDDIVEFVTDPATYIRIGAIALGIAIVGVGTMALLT